MSETRERVKTRADVLRVLRAHEAELRAMGIERLDLFGSFARDEAGPDSDVDLYAQFGVGVPMAASRYFVRQYAIEDIVGRPIDLHSGSFDNPYFYRSFSRDALRVL